MISRTSTERDLAQSDLDALRAEIHRYLPEFGYRVFTDTALHSGPSTTQPPPRNGTDPGN